MTNTIQELQQETMVRIRDTVYTKYAVFQHFEKDFPQFKNEAEQLIMALVEVSDSSQQQAYELALENVRESGIQIKELRKLDNSHLLWVGIDTEATPEDLMIIPLTSLTLPKE